MSLPFLGQWYLQAGGGIGIPVSSQEAAQYYPGYSGEIQVGWEFIKDFALALDGRLDFLPLNKQQAILMLEQQYGFTGLTGTTTGGFTHRSLDLVGRFYLPFFKPLRFYVFCGVGAAFDSVGGNYSASWNGGSQAGAFIPENWTNFEWVPGIGVSFPISHDLNGFVEGKVIFDYASTTGSNAEANGTPIVGIPVLAGLNYAFP